MLAHRLASPSLALQGMFFGSVRGGGGVGRVGIGVSGYALWAECSCVGWVVDCLWGGGCVGVGWWVGSWLVEVCGLGLVLIEGLFLMGDVIAWVDVETSGLNPWEGPESRRCLLEVACVVTDGELNVLDDGGFESLVAYSPGLVDRVREGAQPVVREMHDESGLWDRLRVEEGLSLFEVDCELLSYVSEFAPEPRSARLGGNSVRLDLNFLEASLPMSYAHLSHRFVDVTTVSTLFGWWGGVPRYRKEGVHSAMADVRESLEELRYLKSKVGFAV